MKYLIITAFFIACNVLPANSNAVCPSTADSSFSMAVIIKDFTARVTGNKTKLHWSVLNNNNASSIEVEYSADGKLFTQAGLVWCSEQSTTENYGITINNKSNYYRLKLICKDGTILYANTSKQ